MIKKAIFLLGILFLAGCTVSEEIKMKKNVDLSNPELKTAIFAGGCFWCMEAAYENTEGVAEAISGYIGGSKEDATYEKVSTGTTGHLEAVKVYYDPKKVKYEKLLEVFFFSVDPTDGGGQFADRGNQYKTAAFYNDEDEKEKIGDYFEKRQADYDKPIATKILPVQEFYPAEEYHQDYYIKQSGRYKLYAKGSGRTDYINQQKKESEEELKARLTPLQWKVTQEEGTEPAFNNEYWDNHEEGIYVDIVDGTPLFASTSKYDSGTGWPSFTEPIDEDNVVEKEDNTLGMKRTEVEGVSGSHLGHVFNDGPNGKPRYCMNSAAMRFIPKDKLEEEGYGEYLKLFN